MIYDLIGDIHGHADELKALLTKLGYVQNGGVYRHSEPDRKAVFVGDFIDRGTQNLEVLRVVRAMWEAGTALAVLGNHEFNALCYHTSDGNGGFLRPHNEKNDDQHGQTLREIKVREGEWLSYMDWMRQLPLYLELDSLRVVHACWDPEQMAELNRHGIRDDQGRLTNEFLRDACRKGHGLYDAVEVLLKGPELKLPDGRSFVDKDGHTRHHVRIQWWKLVNGRDGLHSWGDIALGDSNGLNEFFLKPDDLINLPRFGSGHSEKPVFFGHYWFDGGSVPRTLSDCAACLDYSVAKGGRLVSYTHRGEKQLCDEHFSWVKKIDPLS